MSSDNKITIGIADDNAIFRAGLHKTIEGFKDLDIVISEEDIDTLFTRIGNLSTPPDICIIDISMPDAYHALKRMKEEYPEVKVLVLSSISNELSIIRTIKIGANGFMLKGFSPDKLYEALKSIHQKGDFVSDTYNPMDKEKITHESLTFHLSYLELDMLSQLCTESSMREIAANMGITVKESEKLRDTLYRKIKVKDRVELVLFAIHIGIMSVSQKN